MALSTKAGNFAQPVTTNASFAVTGVGFTPKALLLFATDETGIGISANEAHYMGMATSTSNRAAISSTDVSGVNTPTRGQIDTKCFLVSNAAGTTLVVADLVSFDADGFTLNFSTVDVVARKIGYIAIGGADLTSAFVKEFKPAASNTSQAFTGVGFKPDAMILMSCTNGNVPPSNETVAEGIIFGLADTALNQRVVHSNNAPENWQVAKIIEKSSGGGVATMEATITSFDADGFTMLFTASSSVKYCFALCLKGGQYKVGVFNQATSTGNQAAVTGSFQPTGVILGSWNKAASSSISTANARISVGAASSSAARASIWNGQASASGIKDNDFDSANIISMISEGASPTTNAQADFVSMDSGGFTINNGTADATSREVAYMMMGSNATASNTSNFMPFFRP